MGETNSKQTKVSRFDSFEPASGQNFSASHAGDRRRAARINIRQQFPAPGLEDSTRFMIWFDDQQAKVTSSI